MKNKILNRIIKIDKKIAKFLTNLHSKLNIDYKILLIFASIFLLLFFQHDVISMYFDDFGNGSLSYSYNVPGVVGTNFTFADLLEWAREIYIGWGGRVIYAIFILIPLFKFGITVYMILQAVVITLIIYLIYKIVKEYVDNKRLHILPIILFVLYTLIDMVYLRHGIYWASASILYVWPLLPFLVLVYTNIKICKKKKAQKKINYWITIPWMIFLTFVSTFSQEQIGAAVLAFIISFSLLNHFKDIKNFLIIDLPVAVTSLLSYLLLFLAPGNWARMAKKNVEFSKLSFTEKIVMNFPETMKNIFIDEMKIFMIILTVLMFVIIIKLVIKNYERNKKYLYLLIIIPVLSITALIVKLYFPFLVNKAGITIFGSLWFISMLITSIVYLYSNKKLDFLAIMIAAVVSIFCLLISPTLGVRTGLPYIFLIFIIIGLFISEIFYSCKLFAIKVVIVLAIIILGHKGGRYYLDNYHGYRANKEINNLNFSLLQNYDNANATKTITLYKVVNPWYGTTKSYEEPSMDYWIKEYFDIDHDVTFEWIDIYEDLR